MKVLMSTIRIALCTVLASVGAAQSGAAQTSAVAPRPTERAQLRHQVYVMEGALARAVEFGAQALTREIRTVMPDILMLAGQARARGVYLDNYGIFFDVEVPIMRQSLMWSLRTMLDKDEAGVRGALADLRRLAREESDPRRRAAIEGAAKRLELQFVPLGSPDATPWEAPMPTDADRSGSSAAMSAEAHAAGAPVQAEAPKPIPTDKLWVKDPNRAYTESIQQAIIDAMIDYSAPMRIRPDEWLTVAARDNEQRDSLAPQDPSEEVDTILLQIRGADLAAYRTGAIDRDEARKRVSVRKF